ncbi:MAG: ribonuclease H-like domain-containing protein [Byssovorax sp.]
MASFASKLARLPRLPGMPAEPAPEPPQAPPERTVELDAQAMRPKALPRPAPVAAPGPPSLDELREKIAAMLGKAPPPAPRADPTRGELPFLLERTELGPLYVRRVRSLPGARVGRAPLVAGRDADPAMLALLALDPALAGRDPKGALYVDTETTGLAGGTGTVPFLIGLSWFDAEANAFMLEQVLLRRLGEEAPMLALVAERLRAASMIVSYNGKAFDLPLLKTRFVMNRMEAPALPPHLDLVHVARRVHKARLKSRTLASIEAEVLGRARVGDVSGGDIVSTYLHFLRTADEEALLGVVEHNAADVLSMVALVGLYGEPLGSLTAGDLAGAARVLRRAGALDRAAELADEAVSRGGGVEAKKARGEIAKARGDKARALADYEELSLEVDDPAVRLELSKLYEHQVTAYGAALMLVAQGTGEGEEAAAKRKARLAKKIGRRR